jgi:hypothetical protein
MYRSQKTEKHVKIWIQTPDTRTISPVSPNFVCVPTSSDLVRNFQLLSSAARQRYFEVAEATIAPVAQFPSHSPLIEIRNVVVVGSDVGDLKTCSEEGVTNEDIDFVGEQRKCNLT